MAMESIKSAEMHTEADLSLIPTSPYYLHPVEGPGVILVSHPLDRNNYDSWYRSMRRALKSKKKFRFINGSISMSNQNGPNYDAWDRCNNMVISWITRSLSPHISKRIVYIDNAQELWEDLKERFSKGDYFTTSDVLQEIHSLNQGDKNTSDFFNNVKTLWEELESLRSLPTCICNNKCTCDFLRTFKKHRETKHVICFLKGLNDQYNTVRSQILLMEPLPTINKVFGLSSNKKGNLKDLF
ncbi:PREDICTED: uncharacterized protein LOC109327830 [Lupinus angustifolius]|uniref:uncharacterized protein LOC109327830 n=1 Tax=Lupinus angustifolius TaxID=3871 RepID=UPI00092EAFB7|nr:PREDICTED: uncharacterized protein LOC109327830 [Lupinus angustifolius]